MQSKFLPVVSLLIVWVSQPVVFDTPTGSHENAIVTVLRYQPCVAQSVAPLQVAVSGAAEAAGTKTRHTPRTAASAKSLTPPLRTSARRRRAATYRRPRRTRMRSRRATD